MSDIYLWSLLIVGLGVVTGLVFVFNHFTTITNHQMDLMDKILAKLFGEDEENELISELDKKLSKDRANVEGLGFDGKTHIYGGKTIFGVGVCHDKCWCKGEEE